MVNKKVKIQIIFYLSLLFVSFGCENKSHEEKQIQTKVNKSLKSKKIESPTTIKKIKWKWRKNFSKATLKNLAMAWNGSRIIFSVNEEKLSNEKDSTVIIGLDNKGENIKDWRIEGVVENISLSGEGSSVLLELLNNNLYYYKDWENNQKPLIVTNVKSSAYLSPTGKFLVTNSGGKEVDFLSDEGVPLWSYPSKERIESVMFPFLNQERWTIISQKDKLFLNNGEKLLWKKQLDGDIQLISSSFLDGGVIAVSTKEPNKKILFIDEKGNITGKVKMEYVAASMSCSKVGNICAVYINNKNGQLVNVYSPKGKKLWDYKLKEKSDKNSKVVVAGQGKTVIAGIKEAGNWTLRAWDDKGKSLWIAPVDEGLSEFQVSWSGKIITVLTDDSRIEYFEN